MEPMTDQERDTIIAQAIKVCYWSGYIYDSRVKEEVLKLKNLIEQAQKVEIMEYT